MDVSRESALLCGSASFSEGVWLQKMKVCTCGMEARGGGGWRGSGEQGSCPVFHDLALGTLVPPAHPCQPEAVLLFSLCSGLSHGLFICIALETPSCQSPSTEGASSLVSGSVWPARGWPSFLLSSSSRQQARPQEGARGEVRRLTVWVGLCLGRQGVAARSSSLRVRLYLSKGHPQASPEAPDIFSRVPRGHFSTHSATNCGFLVIPREEWAAHFPWIGEGHPTPWPRGVDKPPVPAKCHRPTLAAQTQQFSTCSLPGALVKQKAWKGLGKPPAGSLLLAAEAALGGCPAHCFRPKPTITKLQPES